MLFVGWFASIGWVSTFWKNVLSFWSEVFGMRSYVSLIHYRLGDMFTVSMPYMHTRSRLPDNTELSMAGFIVLTVFLITFFLPRRYVPVKYLLRLVAFFHTCAILFFAFVPLAFPYGVSGYVHALLIAGLALIGLVPIVLAFTYSIFDFSFLKKLGLTLLIMLYFTILIPMQFAAHALILYHTSLLMLPLLFFVFGLPLDVMIFIAFYSWGASWKNKLYKERPARGNGFFNVTCLFFIFFFMTAADDNLFSAVEDDGESPPRVMHCEVGADFTHFTADYGNGNYEYLAVLFSREWDYLMRFELGRAERFGDAGTGAGASLTRFLSPRWSVSAGFSAGTGEFILPRYRLNVSIGKFFLPERNLGAELGYVHDQSKGENYFDRIFTTATWYTAPHWMLSGYFNYDMGHPGSTRTKFGGIGLTWYTWQKRYIGGLFEYGDVNYTQVGPANFLVSYSETLFKVYYTEYFNTETGLTLRLDTGTNDFYDLVGFSVIFFREW
jgi:YaiO family outer membrane protein